MVAIIAGQQRVLACSSIFQRHSAGVLRARYTNSHLRFNKSSAKPSAVPQAVLSSAQPTQQTKSMASSTTQPFPSLVSAEWLMENIDNVKILDASWYMPNQDRDAIAEFKSERLPGAEYFDLDEVADRNTDLPHMLPSEHQFAAAADALGITNDDTIVIYDRLGLFSSPRAWWTWRVFGHKRVAVLDGGMNAWKAIGGEIDTTKFGDDETHKSSRAAQHAPADAPVRYQAKLDSKQVRSREEILDNVRRQSECVVDARPAPRWKGKAPEPRPGLEMGHIPGSINIPWDSVLQDGRMLPAKELKKRFREACVDFQRPMIFSCGSGTTACILGLALNQMDPSREFSIYDGSWSEWGKPELQNPIATSASIAE